jgi:hypothetical protein
VLSPDLFAASWRAKRQTGVKDTFVEERSAHPPPPGPRSCRCDDAAEIARTRTRVPFFKGKQQGKAPSEWNGGTGISASQQFSCQEDQNASHDRMDTGDSVDSGRTRVQCIGAKSNTNERTGNSTNRQNYAHDGYMYDVQEMEWYNARRGCKPIEKGVTQQCTTPV